MIKLLRNPSIIFTFGLFLAFILIFAGDQIDYSTSTNEYCQSCHVHTDADNSWKQSDHFHNRSGVQVGCVDCHLPPKTSRKYLREKLKAGLKDFYGFYFKDHDSFDWKSRRTLEHAVTIVFNKSCVGCHQNLFPKDLSRDGEIAHLYYETYAGPLNLQCINCHLRIGHYDPGYVHGKMTGVPIISSEIRDPYTDPAKLTVFENYTETIPNTTVSFQMIAIEGGTFHMGSPNNEPFRRQDEGPVREVTVSPFFMGKVEVTWDEYWSFFIVTMSEGRTDPAKVIEHNLSQPDAITGPTPYWGIPDQGWGGGRRPAITMTHYAATIYCQWLSEVTGKTYRLPTEAEWEYAARAGTTGPYFFEGSPRQYSRDRFVNRIFGPDTNVIDSYVVYRGNSRFRTQEPDAVRPNPFGLKNMLGNVYEYCADWYAPDAYSRYPAGPIVNPKGPESGEERVIRGGSFNSDAGEVRVAARNQTRHEKWQVTDPQIPKSLWWYTDTREVGFRVVMEPDNLVFYSTTMDRLR